MTICETCFVYYIEKLFLTGFVIQMNEQSQNGHSLGSNRYLKCL